MNYYLVKIVINDKGQDGTSIEVYNNLTSAQVNYHNTLASYYNDSTVIHGVVEIIDTYGRTVGGDNGFREEVNHYPAPEPTPEPSEVTE